MNKPDDVDHANNTLSYLQTRFVRFLMRPDGMVPYRIVFQESAMYPDGGNFRDSDIHRALAQRGFENAGGEWFRCTADDVRDENKGNWEQYPRRIPEPMQKVAETPVALSLKALPKTGGPKPAVDLSDIKAGVALMHKLFGEGRAVKIMDDKIIVAFGKVKKTFLFPSSFENGFLRV